MALTDRDLGLYIIILIHMIFHLGGYLHEQLNPSPSMNGSLHVHIKFALKNPSLIQLAFTSHGSERQGSGTINTIIVAKR